MASPNSAATLRWQAAHPDRVRANARNWRNRWTPEQRELNLAKQRVRTFARRYGLTEEHYQEMLRGQDGHCKLCPRTPEQERYKRLNVDHVHGTQTIRGLLCTPCNHALGVLGDGPDGLGRALEYVSWRL